jgi:hypothetical protein
MILLGRVKRATRVDELAAHSIAGLGGGLKENLKGLCNSDSSLVLAALCGAANGSE